MSKIFGSIGIIISLIVVGEPVLFEEIPGGNCLKM